MRCASYYSNTIFGGGLVGRGGEGVGNRFGQQGKRLGGGGIAGCGGNAGVGVQIQGAGTNNNVVSGNYIGMKADGFELGLDDIQKLGVPAIALIDLNGKMGTDPHMLYGDYTATARAIIPRARAPSAPSASTKARVSH
ncbi:MAG: hypothetical protein HC869_20550 [Rhodospirillales bacterium]|nr:hypothetical protein [Rhodospirillales bacterium]